MCVPLGCRRAASVVVGAKWRREVPPSRRLTAREQSLPWAILSFPAHWCRVNQAALAVGTPAVAGACSKVVNAGSCRPAPGSLLQPGLSRSRATLAALACQSTLTGPPSKARNAAENRPDAIASVSGSDRLLPSRRPNASRRAGLRRSIEAQTTPSPIRHRLSPARQPGEASAQPKFSENLAVCRAAGLAATSCSCPRPVLPINISVPAHAARHYDEFDSGKPDSGADAGVASLVVTLRHRGPPQALSVMSSCIEHAVL